MERLIQEAELACLVGSWIYIFLLRAELRNCKSYIHSRIDGCIPVYARSNGGSTSELGTREETDIFNTNPTGTQSIPTEVSTMAERPRLFLEFTTSQQPVVYRCSHCSIAFPLANEQLPRVAAAELVRRFKEHVRQEHPDAAHLDTTARRE